MSAIPDGEVYSFDQLSSTGVVWLINRCVFHPRGFALALHYADGETQPRGWSIVAAQDDTPFLFGLPEGREDDLFRSVEAVLAVAREHGTAPEQAVS